MNRQRQDSGWTALQGHVKTKMAVKLSAINLGVRFLLEVAGLITLSMWGWANGGAFKLLLTLVIPIAAAAIWGIFAVPDDPSRSGNAPVVVSGLTRLVLELVFFASVTGALVAMNYSVAGTVFGTLVAIHYIASRERVAWVLRQ